MEDIVLLEWSYNPSDYFEEDKYINRENVEITISKGKVEAKINYKFFDINPTLRDDLNNEIYSIFQGTQLLTHRKFDFSNNPLMTRLYPNGRKVLSLTGQGGIIVSGEGIIDFVVKGIDGNIVKDSKKERIDKKSELASLAIKYRLLNQNIAHMLNSYNKAVEYPDNELVHLFEIRDVLQKEFKGKHKAIKALNLSEKEWDRLGSLANVEPFKQGRHCGQQVGSLRDATRAELEEARAIARAMVEAYYRYLELGDYGSRQK